MAVRLEGARQRGGDLCFCVFRHFSGEPTAFALPLLGNCSSRKGLNGACSVYEYPGSFLGQAVHFKMTSVCGHVMSLDFIGGFAMPRNSLNA